MGGYWQSGIETVVWLQGNVAFLQPLMHALSFLATTEFLLFLGLTVYWCIDRRIGIRLGLLLMAGAAAGGILKLVFHMPRPYWYDARVLALAGESTYGMPSMHTLYAWSIGPWLGWRIHRRWGLAAGVLLAIGVSISRICLGVHFPDDVVAGLAVGLFVWLGVDLGIRYLGPFLTRAGFLSQCIAAILVSAILLMAQAGILAGIESAADPAAWAENASRINIIAPRDPKPILYLAGLVLGMGVGLAGMNRWAPFSAKGNIEKRILRFLLGLSVALILYGGLGILWNGADPPINPILRYLRFVLIGFWMVFLAPWLFLRWKLAERAG